MNEGYSSFEYRTEKFVLNSSSMLDILKLYQKAQLSLKGQLKNEFSSVNNEIATKNM